MFITNNNLYILFCKIIYKNTKIKYTKIKYTKIKN